MENSRKSKSCGCFCLFFNKQARRPNNQISEEAVLENQLIPGQFFQSISQDYEAPPINFSMNSTQKLVAKFPLLNGPLCKTSQISSSLIDKTHKRDLSLKEIPKSMNKVETKISVRRISSMSHFNQETQEFEADSKNSANFRQKIYPENDKNHIFSSISKKALSVSTETSFTANRDSLKLNTCSSNEDMAQFITLEDSQSIVNVCKLTKLDSDKKNFDVFKLKLPEITEKIDQLEATPRIDLNVEKINDIDDTFFKIINNGSEKDMAKPIKKKCNNTIIENEKSENNLGKTNFIQKIETRSICFDYKFDANIKNASMSESLSKAESFTKTKTISSKHLKNIAIAASNSSISDLKDSLKGTVNNFSSLKRVLSSQLNSIRYSSRVKKLISPSKSSTNLNHSTSYKSTPFKLLKSSTNLSTRSIKQKNHISTHIADKVRTPKKNQEIDKKAYKKIKKLPFIPYKTFQLPSLPSAPQISNPSFIPPLKISKLLQKETLPTLYSQTPALSNQIQVPKLDPIPQVEQTSDKITPNLNSYHLKGSARRNFENLVSGRLRRRKSANEKPKNELMLAEISSMSRSHSLSQINTVIIHNSIQLSNEVSIFCRDHERYDSSLDVFENKEQPIGPIYAKESLLVSPTTAVRGIASLAISPIRSNASAEEFSDISVLLQNSLNSSVASLKAPVLIEAIKPKRLPVLKPITPHFFHKKKPYC